MSVANEDELSNNQSPSGNAENEHESPHQNEEIDKYYDAACNNQSSHQNEEVQHDNFFDECTEEDNDQIAHEMEDVNESVNTVHLRIIKEAIMDDVSERKKRLKKDWVVKHLRDNHWLIDK